MYTYRDLIRIYATGVAKGTSDTDLPPRQKRLTQVMLNLASNHPSAAVPYPPAPTDRDAAIKHLQGIMWDARALIQACTPSSDADVGGAHERSLAILRGL